MTLLPDATLALLLAATLALERWRRPRWPDRAVLVLFVLSAVAVFYPNEGGVLQYSVERFDVRDGLLLAAYGVLAWDVMSGRRRLRVGWAALAAAAFYGVVLVTAFAGWADGGIAAVRVLRDLRPLVFMSLAFLVPAIVSSRTELTALVRLLATFSALVFVVMPLQIVLAARGVVLLYGFQPTKGLHLLGWSWAGIGLANAFVFVGLYRVMFGRPFCGGPLTSAAAVAGGAGLVAIGLARMNWIALAASALLVVLLVPRAVKVRFVTGLAAMGVVVAALFAAAVALLPEAGERALARTRFLFTTVADPAEYRSTSETGLRTSIGRRLMENEVAWEVFTRHPLLGAGLGHRYWEHVALHMKSGEPVTLRNIYVRGGVYIHNAWLWLLSKAGLFVIPAFAAFAVAPFVAGLARLGALPTVEERAVVFGVSLRGLQLLLESVAHPYFFTVATASGLGVMAGLVLAAFREAATTVGDAASVDRHPVLQRSAWHSLPLQPAGAGPRRSPPVV